MVEKFSTQLLSKMQIAVAFSIARHYRMGTKAIAVIQILMHFRSLKASFKILTAAGAVVEQALITLISTALTHTPQIIVIARIFLKKVCIELQCCASRVGERICTQLYIVFYYINVSPQELAKLSAHTMPAMAHSVTHKA